MRATYPTLDDAKAALEDAGLSAVAPSDGALVSAIGRAVATLENDTEWSPFLASLSPSIRRFRLSQQRILFLRTGIVAEPVSVIVDGTELTKDLNYFLEPENALAEGKPYTRINFGFARSSGIAGCAINARFGYCDALPDDVWSGVLMLALWMVRGELQRRFSDAKVAEQNAAGVIKAKESGPLRVEYATVDGLKVVDLGATFAAWHSAYEMSLQGRVMNSP